MNKRSQDPSAAVRRLCAAERSSTDTAANTDNCDFNTIQLFILNYEFKLLQLWATQTGSSPLGQFGWQKAKHFPQQQSEQQADTHNWHEMASNSPKMDAASQVSWSVLHHSMWAHCQLKLDNTAWKWINSSHGCWRQCCRAGIQAIKSIQNRHFPLTLN